MSQLSIIQNSFVAGEISPSLFGRTDLAKWHNGASTMRNFFVNYRGGAASRAGTAYVGMCKQSGNAAPPRDIPFQFNINQGYALEFGDQYMRIKSNGAYVIENTKAITAITKANPGVFTSAAHGYSNGDWIFIQSVGGMTNFNGLTWIVQNVTTNTFTVTDLFGTAVDTTNFSVYTSGGTAARIYTVVSPYAAVDLPYLKFTQSADVMSLTCVNPVTNTEYPPYDLERFGATNWTFTQVSFAAIIAAPTGVVVTAQNSTTVSTWYSYLVTAIDRDTGEESVASTPGTVENNDISINAGSNTITWTAVANASSYNIYKATPSYSVGVPVGTLYGYMSTAFGTQATDTNIIADFTKVPPTHRDPFARGAITSITITNGGTGQAQATIGYTITTATGSGFVGLPVVVAGVFVAMIIQNPGKGYLLGDTIAITGAHTIQATATLNIGNQTGTYPSVVAYFQTRRFYADTLNAPDTYFASKPGLFLNMDSSDPVQPNDAIIGTPWAQQIDGVQFMIPMPGGLVVFTGKGAWQIGGGGTGDAITPSNQVATPQAYNGCNDHVPPIVADYDILYVQAKGSVVRDLSYNFFANIYTGTDKTVLSNHLFVNHTIVQWGYAEEPFKVIWAVRDDGILLSFTYLKEQDVYSWARHDTNGLFMGVCCITEPPVDATYLIIQRYVRGAWRYYSERMDNRYWPTMESCFCVDAGLSWPMTFPAATLNVLTSGTGTGVHFTTSASVFTAGDIGKIIRVGGGKATVTAYNSGTDVTCTITTAITATIPNDPDNMPVPATSGNWSITPTTTSVTGLNHLEGKIVAILADGSVMPSKVVTNGAVSLPQAYSSIHVGLPYTCQLQSLYLDPSGVPSTMQGKRKNISSVSVRVEASRGIFVGTNQPDASVQPNYATVAWSGLKEVKERGALVNAGASIPLFTGDFYVNVPGDWDVKGQVAIQQNYPLPANILAFITQFVPGDT